MNNIEDPINHEAAAADATQLAEKLHAASEASLAAFRETTTGLLLTLMQDAEDVATYAEGGESAYLRGLLARWAPDNSLVIECEQRRKKAHDTRFHLWNTRSELLSFVTAVDLLLAAGDHVRLPDDSSFAYAWGEVKVEMEKLTAKLKEGR